MNQPSLFEEPAPAFAQGSLFDGDAMGQEANRSYIPDVAYIRRRLDTLLDQARRAERMPWSAREARMWQTVFPQMANWLPEDDAKQLRFEFAREMHRLRLAA